MAARIQVHRLQWGLRWLLSILVLLAALSAAFTVSHTAGFDDVAPAWGLNVTNTYGGKERKDYILETTGNGVAIFDYDGDGANDIFFANGTTLSKSSGSPLATPQLYRNDGHGHFTEVGRQAGFSIEGWAQGVCVGDYDNDGRPDLLVTYYGHDRLYHNQGNGTFRDVTADAGLPAAGTRYGSGCTFTDYDRDGHLDIFVSRYVDLDLASTPKPGSSENCMWKSIPVMCGPRGLPKPTNALYRNNGDGTFTDVSAKAGILKPGGRYALGVVAADFDNDGWPDIYVACDMTPSLLFHNRHDGTFEERGVQAGVAYNYDGQLQAGMGVAVADYDGDGLLDIAKTNFSGDLTSLYHNDDGKFFTDVSREAGLGVRQLLGWGIAFIDVDDDGWKDLVLANGHVYPEVERSSVGDRYLQPALLFRNVGNGRFIDVTGDAGPAFQIPHPARGLAIGDLDGDGRPEIVIANMNARPSALKNRKPGGNFVNIALTGRRSNRSGVGARVVISAGGRRYIDELMSGTSYYSNSEPALHFGIGSATRVQTIEVRWPSGVVQEFRDQPVNSLVKVTEGSAEPSVRTYSR